MSGLPLRAYYEPTQIDMEAYHRNPADIGAAICEFMRQSIGPPRKTQNIGIPRSAHVEISIKRIDEGLFFLDRIRRVTAAT